MQPVLQYLDPQPGDRYLDVTAGYGGHASAVLERTDAYHHSVLVDRDQAAIDALGHAFAGKGIRIIHHDFLSAARELQATGEQFELILADLGVSSLHLDTASRGFAFRQPGPLDMRMDQTRPVTAADIVNGSDETKLAEIIRLYGEEPRARKIASLIVAQRPIMTTTELAAVVAKAYPGHSRVHPATRTFQALRIAVNDELELLRQVLPVLISLLAPGGRLGVITFHSLEDRIVKDVFKELAGDRYDSELRHLTKKPVQADKDELVFNPRARSAKLRAVLKINTAAASNGAVGKNKKKKGEAHANPG